MQALVSKCGQVQEGQTVRAERTSSAMTPTENMSAGAAASSLRRPPSASGGAYGGVPIRSGLRWASVIVTVRMRRSASLLMPKSTRTIRSGACGANGGR